MIRCLDTVRTLHALQNLLVNVHSNMDDKTACGSKDESSVHKRRRWINSLLCSAICPRKISPKTARAVTILDDYFKYSSIHGVRYIGKGTLGPWDNVIWLVLVIISSGTTLWFTKSMFDRYSQSPTEIVVANSALPLWSFPFPAVTVCPTEKIYLPTAEQIITESILNSSSLNFSDWSFDFMGLSNNSAVNLTNPKQFSKDLVTDILNILTGSVFPRTAELQPILQGFKRVEHLLPLFSEFNVTKFMLDVLLPCRKLFRICLWSGEVYDCCDLFQLQRTEIGFCYSFNSLTSEARSDCEDDPDLSDYGETSHAKVEGHCTLRRTASAGPGSALKMYLKYPSKRRDPETAIAKVSVGPPRDIPEPLAGIIVPGTPGATVRAPVTYQYTASASVLRRLPVTQRGCLLGNERRLRVSRFYSRRSCIFECRQDFLKQNCGCLPYPYSSPGTGRECHLDEYPCVARVSGALQFFTPAAHTPGFLPEDYSSTLNCTHCWKNCHAATYKMSLRQSSGVSSLKDICVDVFMEGLNSAVLYRRKVVYSVNTLLVSLGGVANLFLGISYLSLLELVVLLIKLFFTLRPIKRR